MPRGRLVRALTRATLVLALGGAASLADGSVALPERSEAGPELVALLAADVSVPAVIRHRPIVAVRPSLPARSVMRSASVQPAPPAASRSLTRRHPPVQRSTCDTGAGWQQRRVQRALRSISYPWQDLGYRIEVRAAKQGYLGMTYPQQRLIVLWVRSCRAETDVMLRVTLAHEIGHAVDFTYGNDQRRERWLELRGAEGTPWFCCAEDDFSLGAGDFAEVFAYWQAGPGYYLSRVARPPTREQLAELIPFFGPR